MSIGNFFSQLGKNLVPEARLSFVQRNSPVIKILGPDVKKSISLSINKFVFKLLL